MGVTAVVTYTDRAGKLGGGAVATITVPEPVAVASLAALPESARAVVGGAVLLLAITTDAAGNPLYFHPVTWITSDPSVARVDTTGLSETAGRYAVRSYLIAALPRDKMLRSTPRPSRKDA